MGLNREKRPLFFIVFLLIGSQIVAAQEKYQLSPPGDNRPPLSTTGNTDAAAIVSEPPGDVAADVVKTARPEAAPKLFESISKIKSSRLNFDFRPIPSDPRSFDFRSAALREPPAPPFQKMPPPPGLNNDSKNDAETTGRTGFNWRGAITQSLLFLGVQHGYAVLGQQKTRHALKGNFWNDYIDSVKALRGWDDGGRFFTNYIAHPIQGSLTGFIYVQNSPQATRAQFGRSRAYWRSRGKAMLWTTVWSTQFEIGPISQASIGNVGQKGKQTWEDIVITPTLGTAMLVTEDALDRFFIRYIERRTDNFYIKIFARMLFNPTRNFANILRLKPPWHRDR